MLRNKIMTSRDEELIPEDLDTLLENFGINSSTTTTDIPPKDDSLDELLNQVMGDSQFLPYQEEGSSSFPFLREEVKPKRSRLPLWFSLALLGGFFLGSVFGFYWGKGEKMDSSPSPYEEINEKLSVLVSEIQEIYQKITPVQDQEEIIEPLEPPSEMEKLSPKTTM